MIELRSITDPGELISWRKEVIANVFGSEPDEALTQANRRYYERHMSDDTHVAYLALDDGKPAGCGAMCLADELPSPDNATGRCAYLMNIYVREAYRNHGIAHMIVTRLVEEARARGCGKIYLETTDMAKTLYLCIGFKDMENMMKYED